MTQTVKPSAALGVASKKEAEASENALSDGRKSKGESSWGWSLFGPDDGIDNSKDGGSVMPSDEKGKRQRERNDGGERKIKETYLFNKMNGDAYVNYRLKPLLEHYQKRSFELSAKTNSMEALTILFTAAGSLFPLLSWDIFIPITVGIAGFFAQVKGYKGYDKVRPLLSFYGHGLGEERRGGSVFMHPPTVFAMLCFALRSLFTFVSCAREERRDECLSSP